MSSTVDICNMAIAEVDGRSINSLDEKSREAQQCKLWFDNVRDFILRDTEWQFAKKTAVLALLDVDLLEWVYGYKYPSDCHYMRSVVADIFSDGPLDTDSVTRIWPNTVNGTVDPEAVFAIENVDGERVIGTDLTNAYGIYTKKVTDTALFDPLFETAMTHYLAATIAIPVVGLDKGRILRSDSLQLYNFTLSTAVSSNENERKRPPRRLPAQIRVRR